MCGGRLLDIGEYNNTGAVTLLIHKHKYLFKLRSPFWALDIVNVCIDLFRLLGSTMLMCIFIYLDCWDQHLYLHELSSVITCFNMVVAGGWLRCTDLWVMGPEVGAS